MLLGCVRAGHGCGGVAIVIAIVRTWTGADAFVWRSLASFAFDCFFSFSFFFFFFFGDMGNNVFNNGTHTTTASHCMTTIAKNVWVFFFKAILYR